MRNIDPRGNKQQLMMPCPCTTCLNHIEHKVEEVQFHLFKYGIDLSYTKWDKHGEKDEQATTAQIPVNATTEFVDDTDFDMDFGLEIPTDGPATVEMVNATKESFDEDDLAKFQELLLDAEKPLYKGCPDFIKLSAIVKLLNLKGLKIMRMMGSGYKKIHVCSNNCILYWKDNKELTVCPTCGISRWKVDNKTHKVYENIPAKAWRTIDEKFPEIAKDPRNLRLGISADGVDVNSGTRHHSVWPVLSVIYNLPPWLWVDTYDASTKENFNLRAVVLWTINDYLMGNNLWLPIQWIQRRYLPYNHPFRRQKKAFNGQQEFQLAPNPLTGEQIYNEVQHIENKWGKGKRIISRLPQKTKKIREVELRYWRHNSVPHCIDFMHVEKNVYESLVRTLLNVPGKTKDGMNARLDLEELRIKPELFARQEEDKTTLPPVGYILTNAKKDIFCETLSNIRVPQGYCSNFSILVSLKDRKLIGLKSQDYHMLMQEEEINLQELDKMHLELVVTLCLLEKFFPPSFFDIMIHLTVYLTKEVKLCGPICFQWMYPFERCMKVIKGHVRNRNRPEGCIAKETIAEETIEFFSDYHKTMKTIGIPLDKHVTNENEDGRPLLTDKSSEVSGEVFQKAHLYVLQNTVEIVSYIEWISYGPRATIVKYEAYNINGYTFRTKSNDGIVYQNSGVNVEAVDLHISKEVASTRKAFYYGVLQEIWILDYRFKQIPIFKCD
ncbi:putative transposon, En/Spm-like protein [Tanacetum coccineum]